MEGRNESLFATTMKKREDPYRQYIDYEVAHRRYRLIASVYPLSRVALPVTCAGLWRGRVDRGQRPDPQHG